MEPTFPRAGRLAADQASSSATKRLPLAGLSPGRVNHSELEAQGPGKRLAFELHIRNGIASHVQPPCLVLSFVLPTEIIRT